MCLCLGGGGGDVDGIARMKGLKEKSQLILCGNLMYFVDIDKYCCLYVSDMN